MNRKTLITGTTYAVLTAVATLSFVLPRTFTVPTARAAVTSELTLTVVRDFHRSHPDFDVVPDGGSGQYAATVARTLSSSGYPIHAAPSERVSDFVLSDQLVVPGTGFAVQATVLGAAIYSGSYHRPVTVKIQVGDLTFDPFGPYVRPVQGSVNDDQSATGWANPGADPRVETLDPTFPAGTDIVVIGKSWQKESGGDSGLENDHWETKLVASTADGGDQVRVLVDGDPVPDIDGAFGQDSVGEFVEDYIDYGTGTMDLGEHQVIFLFELANTGGGGDYQDLVVLLSLAEDPGYFIDGTIGGGDTSTLGGYKVLAPWTDSSARPVAPHLAGRGASFTGAGPWDVLLVVADAGAIEDDDRRMQELFESWGHTVEIMDDGALPAEIDAAVARNDVAYVTHMADSAAIASNLIDAAIGIVNANFDVRRRLGFPTGGGLVTMVSLDVRDDTHPLTAAFDTGALQIFTSPMAIERTNAPVPGGSTLLAARNPTSDKPLLQTLETGATLVGADLCCAPARRVQLPWGKKSGAGAFDPSRLSLDGMMLLSSALGWAAGADVDCGGSPVDACGGLITDADGMPGAYGDGGISSSDTFGQWFRDVLGVNASGTHRITLTRDGAGVWSYLTDAFHPIDGKLFGNEGDPHNICLTYTIDARFTYRRCWQQFVEFEGGDGVWVFVDGQLVLDLGGVGAPDGQRVDLDRLGLADGEEHTLQFFYAQRDPANGRFRLRTNIDLEQDFVRPTISAMFD